MLFPAAIAELFSHLASLWRQDTQRLSSVTKKLQHPAYRRIILMGEAVVPLILRELEQRSGLWFAALEEITQASPVSHGATVEEAAIAWLKWGSQFGFSKK